MSLEEIEAIRTTLTERKAGLAVNQQILFKYAAALPTATRIGLYIAGWGPVVLFPVGLMLYFVVNWKVALFTVFLSTFWLGMGRKFAQAVIRRQCFQDKVFLKLALSVELVKLI